MIRAVVIASGLVACAPPEAPREWPTTTMVVPLRTGLVEVHDAEALADGSIAIAGRHGGVGMYARVDAAGVAAYRDIGRFVTDLAVEHDELHAIGWDERATYWRLDRDGTALAAEELPETGVGIDPYRVLPGPIVTGTYNPITSGVLGGWIARRTDDTWREEIRYGGGYSGFLAAATHGDGFVVAGMGSDTARYQGWVGVERAGTWRERHVGNEGQIFHAVAPLSSGGFVVAGDGFVKILGDDLETIAETSWRGHDPFTYAPVIVDEDVAWLLSRHGRLRNQYSRVELRRLDTRLPLREPELVATYDGTTGGALVQRPDGVVWCVTSGPFGTIRLDPLTP